MASKYLEGKILQARDSFNRELTERIENYMKQIMPYMGMKIYWLNHAGEICDDELAEISFSIRYTDTVVCCIGTKYGYDFYWEDCGKSFFISLEAAERVRDEKYPYSEQL